MHARLYRPGKYGCKMLQISSKFNQLTSTDPARLSGKKIDGTYNGIDSFGLALR